MIIQGLSGGRIHVDELRPHQGTGKIIGDETAQASRFDDVVADDGHPFFSGFEFCGHHITAGKPVFDHLYVNHVWREDRSYRRSGHTGQKKYFAGNRLEGVKKLGVKYIAIFLDQRHYDLIATAKITLIFEQCLYIFVFERQQFFIARIHAQLQTVVTHDAGEYGKYHQNQQSIGK